MQSRSGGAAFSGASNGLSQALFQTPAKPASEVLGSVTKTEHSLATNFVQQPEQPVASLNILVSIPSDARVSTLLRRVEADYRRKTQGTR